MRRLTGIAATALLVPALALAAGGKPASPGGHGSPKVMVVLRGTLTAYTAANGATNGSVTIMVTGANRRGASLKGQSATFAVSASTKIVGTFTAGDRGLVKLRGPKAGLGAPSTFASLVAWQVIDQHGDGSSD